MTADLLTAETLTEITQQLWLAVVPGLGELDERSAALEEEVTARIDISGSLEATVELASSWSLLRRLAAAMFGTSPEDLGEEDLDDALGELVNIVGGNLKSLLPPPAGLSLPRVLRDPAPGEERRLSCQTLLNWEQEPFAVRLLEPSPAP